MRILVIGSGGREHALVWKLAQSPQAPGLFCAPGNAGIAEIASCFPADPADIHSIAKLAESLNVDLTVVGPEVPLVEGVADLFASLNLRLVGPSRQAARLEGSKSFAKHFMVRHSIPTAGFADCQSPDDAISALESRFRLPVVVKADGLAAGKGVSIVEDRSGFDEAIEAMMIRGIFGDAGKRIVIEERLRGREASVMVFTDGRDYKVIAPAQDYKRVGDGDVGPNTGGMGSFSIPGLINESMLSRITSEIVEPALAGMHSEGAPFSGILYFGLMLTADGPKVIEFNARFGDPETQAVLPRLGTDLVEVFESIVRGSLGSTRIVWSDYSTVCVVLASAGYPGAFEKGKPISGLQEAESVAGAVVFQAGTMRDEQGSYLTSGGRVLGVTGTGATLREARARAYETVHRIDFEGMHYRNDIAAAEGE